MSRNKGIPRKVRESVLWRSKLICEVCHLKPGEHLHHRKMRSQGGEHTVHNLLHVCHACHNSIHANPAESYELGYLIKSWDAA